ncbi:MAG: succinyldiaminopimelate transaminase [Gammaproteobacteria bacterium]|nr:succinyldiaminopimelate transaminase [Gammaproteobacteria bacterium]
MNPNLNALHRYPFQRLDQLLANLEPEKNQDPIPLSLGEPRHRAPEFIINRLKDTDLIAQSLGTYPVTRGIPELRQAITEWANKRYDLAASSLDPESHLLPVNGTREALFSFAQATIDVTRGNKMPLVLMPNPFYQIYEGACILAGAHPVFLPCTTSTDFQPDFELVSSDTWQSCQLLYICTPGNPTGAVLSVKTLEQLVEKSLEYDFIIASDECYSEIYYDEAQPPPGLLQACHTAGNSDYKNCVVFNSLSKRSNLPGLRSGFVAGDSDLIEKFLLYRTYHGSAMPKLSQWVSTLAWQDENHVIANRQVYRDKFNAVFDLISNVMPVKMPPAGFYLWPETPAADELFTRDLYLSQNVTVLPGSYLSRESDGLNPGFRRVRMALVAPLEDCITAAERVCRFLSSGA